MNKKFEEEFAKFLQTIKLYPNQLKQSWEEVFSLDLPKDYKGVENIVFCGMGGSALGARMVDSFVSESRLRVPFEIFTEFHVPDYSNSKTLVILSSYSGNTEETIHAAHMAISKKCKVFGITTGGKLAEILGAENIPAYVFEPKYNPSEQPRMSIGYASGAILALISNLGLSYVTSSDINKAAEVMARASDLMDENANEHENIAKAFVKKIKNKLPVLVASEHLLGVVHAIKNQFNENAKTFSVLFDLPELNHHLMEGLSYPHDLKKLLHFVFFTSDLYPQRVKARYPLTREVVNKNEIDFSVYHATSSTKFTQVFETLAFGSFAVYYLTKDLNINPTTIPWVDYFKRKLSN